MLSRNTFFRVAPAFALLLTMRVSAKPPEKRSIFERIENSALFNAASRWAVKEYSKGLLKVEDYNLTSERGKQNIMQEHSVATIGVILYEFATGSGPSSRYFDETSLFTQQVKQSPGIEWMVSKYAAQYNSDSLVHISRDLNQYNVRYQFSPMLVPVRTNTWLFSIQEHLKTLEYKNLSQILLGSFNADILYVDDQTIQVHLWNRTSKKSLFGGFGRRLQRPLLLGTVKQHIVFELSIAEINSILKK